MPRTLHRSQDDLTPGPWAWPAQYDALDRLERELVEDLAAAILSAKVARRDASDRYPTPAPGGVSQNALW